MEKRKVNLPGFGTLTQFLFVIWILFVYGFHYWGYYGPRLIRFLQQWGR